MATQYDQEKISAHDAAQITEHHTKPGNLAASMSPERRQEVEKKLKRKLDARCSLFVLIYIMNCKPLQNEIPLHPNHPMSITDLNSKLGL